MCATAHPHIDRLLMALMMLVSRTVAQGQGQSPPQGLLDSAGLFEFEPRRARTQRRRISVAKVDEEVRLPPTIRKERCVHLGAVEASHGTAVEAQSARGQDEVPTLHRAALKCQTLADGVWRRSEPRADVGPRWRQLRHLF